jgi:hypothetical protein
MSIAVLSHGIGVATRDVQAEMSRQTATRVGAVASLLSLAAVLFANYGVYERLLVRGNVAQTVANILANETLFRVAIACDVIYIAGVLVMISTFYFVLEPVNRAAALLATLFRVLFVVMWAVNIINHLEVLRMLGSESMRVFEPDQLQALARFRLSGFDAYYGGLPFFGLAATMNAWLWLKSRCVPNALAMFGVIASAWCVVSALTFLVYPAFGRAINLYTLDSALGAFELALAFWLLFRGLRLPDTRMQSTRSDGGME